MAGESAVGDFYRPFETMKSHELVFFIEDDKGHNKPFLVCPNLLAFFFISEVKYERK